MPYPVATISRIYQGDAKVLFPGVAVAQDTYADFAASLAGTGCTIEDLGVSSDGVNHVYGMAYGDASHECVFFTAAHHGAEWAPSYGIREFMRNLVTPPAGCAGIVADLLARFRFYGIPIVNPPGWISGQYFNANTVNLNRNYDFDWAAYDDSGQVWNKGSAAFSEVETQYVRDKVLALKPVIFIDSHQEGIPGALQTIYCMYGPGQDDGLFQIAETEVRRYVGAMNIQRFQSEPVSNLWAASQPSSVNAPTVGLNISPYSDLSAYEQGHALLNAALLMCQHETARRTSGTGLFYTCSDTQISQGQPNNNLGGMNVFGTGYSSTIRRSLLKFDLSVVPSTASAASATLRLFCSSEDNTTDRTVSVHRALVEWWEGNDINTVPEAGTDAATWNNRNANGPLAWNTAGGGSGTDYVAAATASALITGPSAWFEWDVTADVQDFIDGSASNFGWFLINTTEATTSRKLFYSRQASTDAGYEYRPQLVVTWE